MEGRRSYDSDLTDAEWSRLEPLVPAPKHGGRPAKHTRREILNGICYAIRSGGAWKLLSHDLPAWCTVALISRLRYSCLTVLVQTCEIGRAHV